MGSARPSALATAAGLIGPVAAGETFARCAEVVSGLQEEHPVVWLAIAKAFPAVTQQVREADSLRGGDGTGRCLPWSSDVCRSNDREK